MFRDQAKLTFSSSKRNSEVASKSNTEGLIHTDRPN